MSNYFYVFIKTILPFLLWLSFTEKSNAQNKSDTIQITIETIDLSEDFNVFSTKNDEILILVYNYDSVAILDQPILIKKFVFDESNTSKIFLTSAIPWK